MLCFSVAHWYILMIVLTCSVVLPFFVRLFFIFFSLHIFFSFFFQHRYSASKAGVIGFVKAVGKEYAETGITINALAPAVVRTAMVEAMPVEQVKYMTDKVRCVAYLSMLYITVLVHKRLRTLPCRCIISDCMTACDMATSMSC